MAYVTGLLLAVPTAKKAEYQKYAQATVAVFKEHGALNVVDCWGDQVPDGELTSFPMAVKCQPDETVVMAWITWPSREVCEANSEKAMSDPRMPGFDQMPFDTKRLIYGGFEVIVDG